MKFRSIVCVLLFISLLPSISSTSCTSDNECLTAEAAQCSSEICVACSDDIHCGHLSSTPYCIAGTCRECLMTSDCTEDLPICDLETNACTACSDDSQCEYANPSKCYCNGGKCGACKTSDHTGCWALIAAKCDPVTFTCTACDADSQCTRFASTPICDAGTCRVCRTSDHAGCSAGQPRCDGGSYQCASCYDDGPCSKFPSTPYCDGAKCQACKPSDNTGCSDPTAAKCDTSTFLYSCVACTGDADCAHFPTEKYCEAGTCVKCKTSDNTGCGESTPFCDGGTTCQACRTSDNDGCTTTAPKCIAGTPNTCTACSDDSDCAGFTSTPCCEGGTCAFWKVSDNNGCSGSSPVCVPNSSGNSCDLLS